MIAFPILIILITAGLLWIFRRRHIRIQWGIGLVGATLAWLSNYIAIRQNPPAIIFPLWGQDRFPGSVFFFSLDQMAVPLIISAASILLVILLTRPSRKGIYSLQELTGIMVFTALTMTATMARNTLTVLLTWMAMDGLIVLHFLKRYSGESDDRQIFTWLSRNIAAIVLLFFTFGFELSTIGNEPFTSGEHTQLFAGLLTLAVFMRFPIFMRSEISRFLGWEDRGSRIILDLFPAIAGVSPLASYFESGQANGEFLVVRIIGLITLTIAILQIVSSAKGNLRKRAFLIGPVGIGMIVASYSSLHAGEILVMSAIVGIYVYFTSSIMKIYDNWHVVFSFVTAAMIIGLPGTPGAHVVRTVYENVFSGSSVAIGILLFLSLVTFSYAFLSKFLTIEPSWMSSDRLTQMSYHVGLSFLVLSFLSITFLNFTGFRMLEVIIFAILLCLVVLLFAGRSKASVDIPISAPKISINLAGMNRLRRITGRFIFTTVKGLADLFEGETGMLWTFVVLLMLVLAIPSFEL